jgi:hypothetical protein
MAFAHQLFKIPGEDVWTLVLRLPGPPRRGSDWFFDFCQANDEWQFERTAKGDILVIPLHGAETSYRVGKIASRLNEWAEQNGSGCTFTRRLHPLQQSHSCAGRLLGDGVATC